MASAEDAARDRDVADDISVGALIDDLTVRRARGRERERAERRDDARRDERAIGVAIATRGACALVRRTNERVMREDGCGRE